MPAWKKPRKQERHAGVGKDRSRGSTQEQEKGRNTNHWSIVIGHLSIIIWKSAGKTNSSAAWVTEMIIDKCPMTIDQ
jgi:hypothetical protein